MKRLLIALGLVLLPAVVRAQVTNPLINAMYIAADGDCDNDACTSAIKRLCRESVTATTVYVCNTVTGFYVPIAGGGGGGAPGGSDTQDQFNDAGAFAGDPDKTWNKTTNLQTISGTAATIGILLDNTNETLDLFSRAISLCNSTIAAGDDCTYMIADTTGGFNILGDSGGLPAKAIVTQSGNLELPTAAATVDGKNLDNMVDTVSSQTISGAKTFTGLNTFEENNITPLRNMAYALPVPWTSVGAATSRVATGTDNKTLRPRHRFLTTSATSDTPSTWTAGEVTDVMPIILDTTGPGAIMTINFTVSQGQRANWAMLSYLRLQVFHDGEATEEATTPESGTPCVDAPLGMFMGQPGKFGSVFSYKDMQGGLGLNLSGSWDETSNDQHLNRTQLGTYHSMFFDSTSGIMANHMVQPFGTRVLVRIKNDCENECFPVGVYYQIEYVKGTHNLPFRLHAKYKQVFPAVSGSSMTITPTITGVGQFLGIIGTQHARQPETYEGDVFVRIDGQTQEGASIIYGGFEDFWHVGFYINKGVEAGDFSGTLTQHAILEGTNRGEIYHGYRFFPGPIPFSTSFQIDQNHGDDDIGGLNLVVPVYWGGVSFWYQVEPCAAVTVPPFRPAADSTSYTSGRIPPAFTNPTNTHLPVAGAYPISPESGMQADSFSVVQNGLDFSSSLLVWDADTLSVSGSDALGGGILEIPFTDGAGGNDYVIFRVWIPAPIGVGVNKLDVYYGKKESAGIFNTYISDNGACTVFRQLTLSTGSEDAYSASATTIGDEIGSATYNVADFAIGASGEMVCIKLQMNGKNASSSNFGLYPDLFVVRP